jgi:hypothetical protein
MNKLQYLFKSMRKIGRLGAVVLAITSLGLVRAYASTDGFCTSGSVITTTNNLIDVAPKITSIKTTSLDQGQKTDNIAPKAGKNKVTHKVTKHCGRFKSDSIIRTSVVLQVTDGQMLIGTRHNVVTTTSIPFKITHIDDPRAFIGTSSTSVSGDVGLQDTTYSVAEDEGQTETKTLVKTVVTREPIDEIIADGSKQHEFVTVVTYPEAYPGQYATLTAKTLPGSSCNISVRYSSGYSTAQGLYTKTSDGDGGIAWSWTVGTRTYSGDWPITISCTLASDSATATSHIIVK